MQVGYARVSTTDQSLAVQLEALQQHGCTKIFQEVASGRHMFGIPIIPQFGRSLFFINVFVTNSISKCHDGFAPFVKSDPTMVRRRSV